MTDRERSVPLAAFVLAAPDVPAHERARAEPWATEAAERHGGVAIATCHRVELYVTGDAPAEAAATEPTGRARRLDGTAAARQAIGLAIGLESAVVGEDQVLHQVRTSVAAARAAGGLAGPIELLFDLALRAGRTARSWRPGRPHSLADVAVARLRAAHHGSLADRRVLVLGAGEMGRKAAIAAGEAGATVAVGSPTGAHALAVATAAGGRVVPFDPGPDGLNVDAVMLALSGPWPADAATMERMAGVPIVVDLSMPPAVPRWLIERLGRRFHDIDRLSAPEAGEDGAGDRLAARYAVRLESLRERTVDAYLERLAARDAAEVAGALANRIEREREAELAALWRRLPDMPDRDREAVEAMTQRLADRLFRAPLAQLGPDGDDRRRQAARELFEL